MDPITLGIAIAIMRALPGTATAEAAAVLAQAQAAIVQAQAVADSIPSDYTELSGRVGALESLGFSLDSDGYVCQN